MKNTRRALRRYHIERLKKKRQYYWNNQAKSNSRTLGRCVNTPHLCSCWLCGNQRKHHGKTVQERRFLMRKDDVY